MGWGTSEVYAVFCEDTDHGGISGVGEFFEVYEVVFEEINHCVVNIMLKKKVCENTDLGLYNILKFYFTLKLNITIPVCTSGADSSLFKLEPKTACSHFRQSARSDKVVPFAPARA